MITDTMTGIDLTGSVVVVTGATRGIGRETAMQFAERNASVVVTGRSSENAPHRTLPGSVEATVREIQSAGGMAFGIAADLAEPEGRQSVVDGTLDRFGRCDILVSNAAFMWTAPVLESPARRFALAYQVNVVALVDLVQGFVPAMIERGRGRIIAVSSGSALMQGRPNFSVYGCSKLALERLNDSLHAELGGQGVSFNVLRIDETVPTEMYELSKQAGAVDDPVAEATMYTAEQTAACILWMASQPAQWSGRCIGFGDLRDAGLLAPH